MMGLVNNGYNTNMNIINASSIVHVVWIMLSDSYVVVMATLFSFHDNRISPTIYFVEKIRFFSYRVLKNYF